jgi:hypothetical protein
MTEVTSRLFFKQIIEYTGWFPIEVNVFSAVNSLINGLYSTYQYVMTFFSGNDM